MPSLGRAKAGGCGYGARPASDYIATNFATTTTSITIIIHHTLIQPLTPILRIQLLVSPHNTYNLATLRLLYRSCHVKSYSK